MTELEKPKQEKTGQDPKDAAGGGQQPETGQQPAGRVFTQADVDRIIAERLTRQKAQFSDYDDLKSARAELDKIKEERMSEVEKAQKRAAEAEKEREQALQFANDRLIRAAFVAEAAKVGAAHPEDVYNLADLGDVSVADDGAVSGVQEAVSSLVEAGRLVMAGKPKAPSLDGGAGAGDRPEDKKTSLTEEELRVAQRLNVSPEDYQKHKLGR